MSQLFCCTRSSLLQMPVATYLFLALHLSSLTRGPFKAHGRSLEHTKDSKAPHCKFFFGSGLKADIQQFITQYDFCHRNKSSNLAPSDLLQPLPIPTNIWEDISMDFIEVMSLSTVLDSVLVLVNHLSKYGHFIGLYHPFSSQSVAAVFISGVVCLHGFYSLLCSTEIRFSGVIFDNPSSKVKTLPSK